jgi:choline kinase
MNIIIPLGGKGERFQKNGFTSPKPLIKIFDKEMILYVLDNLNLSVDDKLFIIYYNVNADIFENTIKSKYPNIYFVELKEQTRGASETIYKGLQQIINITNHKKTMLLDCDTFYTEDVISVYRNIDDFIWLRNTLVKAYPGYIIPNLHIKKHHTRSIRCSVFYLVKRNYFFPFFAFFATFATSPFSP